MHTNPVVLIVNAQDGNFNVLRQAVVVGGSRWEARRADDVPAALARIAGGGVKLILVDVSGGQDSAGMLGESIRRFRAASPGLAVTLWSDSDDHGLPQIASQAGATGCVMGERDPQKLARIISGTLENDEAGGPMSAREKGIATIISVMGVKGGVGTSTVATNLAAALTERGTVILAELRPTFGSLGSHFRPGRMVPGLSSKWDADVAGMRSRVAAALWPVPSVPRLRILFGPQTPLDCGEINPERIATLLRILAAEADFLVTDLPASLDPSNREILSRSHYMALVMEPARACMGLAKLTLEGINMWEKAPRSISAVIVKRTAEGSPLPLAEIEAELGIPMQCVIPPAPELWLRGERTRVPLIQCDADSLAADTFFTMSREYPLQTMRLVGKPLH